MTNSLPHEVWVMILQYIPLYDRMKNVQLVNKHLRDLCWASLSTKNLNFESAIFMPEKVCLRMVRKVKTTVTNLSFRDSHWFPTTMFRKFPVLPSLISLDVRRCFLTGTQLYTLLKNAPNLKNLAFSTSQRELDFLLGKSQTLPEAWPPVQLQRLHIHFYERMWRTWEEMYFRKLNEKKVFSLFFPASAIPPQSLSVEFDANSLNWCFPESERTLDFGHCIKFRYSHSQSRLCSRLFEIGLHAQAEGRSRIPPKFDLTKVRFLSLPAVESDRDANRINRGCEHGSRIFPKLLPNLEYLNMDISWNETPCLQCYETTKKNILLDCVYPNVKYLSLGGGTSQNNPPIWFYEKLTSLKFLKELNLRNADLDFNLLVDEFAGLGGLHSLSLCLNDTILKQQGKNDREISAAAASFFASLTENCPSLKKLEVYSKCQDTPGSWSLFPLSRLSELEVLSLNGFTVTDSVAFASVLKDLIRLRSFSFVEMSQGAEKCKYERLLLKGLACLPNLTELRLMHHNLKFYDLDRGLCKCRNLEKIVLRGYETVEPSDKELYFSCYALYNLFDVVISWLPRLHMFAMISSQIKSGFDTYSMLHNYADQQRSRYGMELYCDKPPRLWGRDHGVSSALYHFIGDYKIMNHTAYDFPYSKQ